jgi:hypothetical protein
MGAPVGASCREALMEAFEWGRRMPATALITAAVLDGAVGDL